MMGWPAQCPGMPELSSNVREDPEIFFSRTWSSCWPIFQKWSFSKMSAPEHSSASQINQNVRKTKEKSSWKTCRLCVHIEEILLIPLSAPILMLPVLMEKNGTSLWLTNLSYKKRRINIISIWKERICGPLNLPIRNLYLKWANLWPSKPFLKESLFEKYRICGPLTLFTKKRLFEKSEICGPENCYFLMF